MLPALRGEKGLLRVGAHHMPLCSQPTLRRWASGVTSLDTALAGGLAYGRVHELYAAQDEDAAAERRHGSWERRMSELRCVPS